MTTMSAPPLTDAASTTLARLQAEQAALARDALKDAPAATDQMGKDTFLKLLVAQLKYQNPLSPSDPSQFMAQTAQFSMVEKLEQMSTATNELLSAERSRAATGLLGNQVTWQDGGAEKSGVVTGVRMGADGPTLEIGDTDVPYALVTKVTPAPIPERTS